MARNITAHGGELINRVASPQRAAELTKEAEKLTSVTLPEREQCDVEMIGIGAFSPLTGFVGEKDFNSICDTMRLANGVAWPIPVTCSVDEKTAAGIDVGQHADRFAQARRRTGLCPPGKHRGQNRRQHVGTPGHGRI